MAVDTGDTAGFKCNVLTSFVPAAPWNGGVFDSMPKPAGLPAQISAGLLARVQARTQKGCWVQTQSPSWANYFKIMQFFIRN